jgi:hypothetical protein
MKIIEKTKSDGREWSFSAGKPKRTIFHYVQIALLLKLPLDMVALVPGVSKKSLFFAIDSLQSRLGLEAINDFIIRDEELLNYRIERVVIEAIKRHEASS